MMEDGLWEPKIKRKANSKLKVRRKDRSIRMVNKKQNVNM